MKLMKTISLREFTLHPTKYLKELPITLTQYNVPVANVSPCGVTEPKRNPMASNYDLRETDRVMRDLPNQIEPPKKQGCCNALQGCKAYGNLYRIEYYDSEGLAKKDVFLCPIHLKSTQANSESVTEL